MGKEKSKMNIFAHHSYHLFAFFPWEGFLLSLNIYFWNIRVVVLHVQFDKHYMCTMNGTCTQFSCHSRRKGECKYLQYVDADL